MFWHDVGESILYDALGTKVSWKAFVRAFSLVSSRAFVIDVFHGYVSLFPVRWAFCQPAFPSYPLPITTVVCMSQPPPILFARPSFSPPHNFFQHRL